MSKMCKDCLKEHCSYEPCSEECQSSRIFLSEEELNKKYLDTLDLSEYISKSNDVKTIIDLIEKDYDDSDKLPQELDGCIFNFLGIDEIAYYLAGRYGLKVNEQVVYTYTLYK